MKIGGFYSHWPKTGGLELYKPLGPSGLTARWRNVPPEVSEPTKEAAKVAPAPAIVEGALNKTGARKAEGPKIHIGFRLAADVVESVKASGPNYNRRVEQALRAAGFGAKAKKQPRVKAR